MTLESDHISFSMFERYAKQGEWKSLFRFIGELLLRWADALDTFGLDLDELRALTEI